MTDRQRDVIDELTGQIHLGDAKNVLEQFPSDSVHMVMTSPPYWKLRDYETESDSLEGTQIGVEETVAEYVDNIAAVCDEIQRVLRPDGSLWLNIGDTYADKDKQLIPEKIAIELQSRGWILRNDATWRKTNPVPQSVTDRLATTTEELFHLTLEKQYYYDLDQIREPCETDRKQGKNPGDVIEVPTATGTSGHCAVYPKELCEKPIQATAPPEVCADCGKPYERLAGRECGECGGFRPENHPECPVCGYTNTEWTEDREIDPNKRADDFDASGRNVPRKDSYDSNERIVTDPRQMCSCDCSETKPAVVLDSFVGSGTTCEVARKYGHQFVGIEINQEYAAKAQQELGVEVHDPSLLRDDDIRSLTSFAD